MLIIENNKPILVSKKYLNVLGNKSKALYKLSNNGLKIPKTLIIKGTDINNKSFSYIKLKHYLQEKFGESKLIIRSDSKIEDGESSSYAGRFVSIGNVEIENIKDSIIKVYNSQKKLIKNPIDIGIIIQEYIECNYSGVIFTADPINETNYGIIEYVEGKCENLVSGKDTPKKIYYSRLSRLSLLSKNTNKFDNLINIGKKIESFLKYPQDIEFGIKDNQIWIFQSRNITTLSKSSYKIINSPDLNKYTDTNFYLYRNEICEVLSSPKTFELDLINKFLTSYAGKIYNKYDIIFEYTNYLELIGGKLYINGEKELNSILTNATLIGNNNIYKEPGLKIKIFSKIFKDIKNIFNSSLMLNKIELNLEEFEELLIKFTSILINKNKDYKNIDYNSFLIDFFKNYYSLIFEINICTSNYSKIYGNLLKDDDLNTKNNSNKETEWRILYNEIKQLKLLGNSISFQDYNETIIGDNYYNSIDLISNGYKNSKLVNLYKLLELREKSRILSILCVNLFRKILLHKIGENYLSYNTSLVLVDNNINIINDGIIPKILSNPCIESDYEKKKSIGYNSIGKGILQIYDGEIRKNNKKYDIIIYTNELFTNIAIDIDKIAGIITNNGGELSHLAIIARENKIPIISGYKLNEVEKYIGKTITINSKDSLLKTE